MTDLIGHDHCRMCGSVGVILVQQSGEGWEYIDCPGEDALASQD